MSAAPRVFFRPKGPRKGFPLKEQPATQLELARLTKTWTRVDVADIPLFGQRHSSHDRGKR